MKRSIALMTGAAVIAVALSEPAMSQGTPADGGHNEG